MFGACQRASEQASSASEGTAPARTASDRPAPSSKVKEATKPPPELTAFLSTVTFAATMPVANGVTPPHADAVLFATVQLTHEGASDILRGRLPRSRKKVAPAAAVLLVKVLSLTWGEPVAASAQRTPPEPTGALRRERRGGEYNSVRRRCCRIIGAV